MKSIEYLETTDQITKNHSIKDMKNGKIDNIKEEIIINEISKIIKILSFLSLNIFFLTYQVNTITTIILVKTHKNIYNNKINKAIGIQITVDIKINIINGIIE